MARQSNSRGARWIRACDETRTALEEARTAQQQWQEKALDLWNEIMSDPISRLSTSMEGLHDIRVEYQEWYDGMSENLRGSITGEKLVGVIDLDLEFHEPEEDPEIEVDFNLDDVESQLDDAEQAELPSGFGRD